MDINCDINPFKGQLCLSFRIVILSFRIFLFDKQKDVRAIRAKLGRAPHGGSPILAMTPELLNG